MHIVCAKQTKISKRYLFPNDFNVVTSILYNFYFQLYVLKVYKLKYENNDYYKMQ